MQSSWNRANLQDTYPDLFKKKELFHFISVYATGIRRISAFSLRKQRELLEETSKDTELQKLVKVVDKCCLIIEIS